MLKHIVMWKFRDGANGKSAHEHAVWMKKHLEALVGVVPQIRSLEVGINEIPTENSFDAVLTVCFDNAEDLKRYKIHNEHKVISEYCKEVRTARYAVDYFTE